jgi:hypothetical protein
MNTNEKLEAVLDTFKADCDANNLPWSSAYARMCGALMAWATEEAANSLYRFYIEEAK